MGRLATLDAGGFHLEPAGRRVAMQGASAAQLFAWCERADVDVLYLHRSALEPLGLPAQLRPLRDGQRREAHPWLAGADSRAGLAPSLERGEREILVGAWQDGAGDPFDRAADGAELLEAVCLFRDAFTSRGRSRGWTFKHTAQSTGWRLMHYAWSHGRRRHNLGEQLATPEQRAELAVRLPEDRGDQLGRQEQPGQVEIPFGGRWYHLADHAGDDRRWAHGYDVNGQRLAACSRLRLGVGEPTRPPLSALIAAAEAGLPGYFLVEHVGHPWGPLIPPIFEPGWHTTPRVRMALQLGVPIRLADGVIWPESVAYLDPFYEAMRDARARLLGARLGQESEAGWRAATLALGALKQAYLQPLGRLRSARAGARGDRLYRPSWYDQVIGRELAVEYLRLHQLADAGVPVLAVYFDAIVIEADQADLYAAAPKPLELSDQLGKFKPVGSLPVPEAHRALMGAAWPDGEGQPDVGRLLKQLKESNR